MLFDGVIIHCHYSNQTWMFTADFMTHMHHDGTTFLQKLCRYEVASNSTYVYCMSFLVVLAK